MRARWPRCTVAACLKTLEAPKMHFIVNFGQFSDRFLFGPVFGQKSQNRTLSEKSDGLAALYVALSPAALSLFMDFLLGKARNEKLHLAV